MSKNSLSIVGLFLAALVAFAPEIGGESEPDSTSGDSLDQADEAYRECIAKIVVSFKGKKKTKQTREEFSKAFSDARTTTHKLPTREIIALWWNDKPEEAEKRILERTLGEKIETPIEDDSNG